MHHKNRLTEKQYIEWILKQNVSYLIYVFKRTNSNDCGKFLEWFKDEMKENARFRKVYLPVVSWGKGLDRGSKGERITKLWRQIELK